MRTTVYIFLLLLVGCQADPNFTIEGWLPDKTFDGEFIYLVPLENAVKESVDSAVIADGKFRIEGITNSKEIFIIRPKPVLRLTLQELLVVKEPGNLVVKIGQNSVAGGTALNDSLQRWKEKKMKADFLNETLRQQFLKADTAGREVIKQKAEVLNAKIVEFHFNFVRNNRDNVVGKFVNKMMGDSFTPEQKKSLNLN